MINANYDSQITFGKKYCLPPVCHVRCCSSAPQQQIWLNNMEVFEPDKFIRKIFAKIPAPNNNPYCRDAVIPVTKPLENYPLKVQKVNGKKVFVLDVGEILKDEKNYCPFLTEYGRCNIYERRPQVCRDFGVGSFYCDDQVTLKEYLKYYWGEYKKMVRQDFANCKKFIQDKFS